MWVGGGRKGGRVQERENNKEGGGWKESARADVKVCDTYKDTHSLTLTHTHTHTHKQGEVGGDK